MFEPKVLFATDLDGDLERGLYLATDLASKFSATLLLLHVVPFRTNDGEALLHRALEASMKRPEQILAALTPTDPAVPYRHLLVVGDPEERILEVAERERVDRILLEVRPRSALQRTLGRSAIERLVARAPCPVVTYRAPRTSARHGKPRRSKPLNGDVPFQALQAMLGARVDALEWWLSMQRSAVRTVADRFDVQDGVGGLIAGGILSSGPALHAHAQRRLELDVGEFGRAMGALGVYVLDPNGETLLHYGICPDPGDTYAQFLERARAEGAAVSVPMSAAANGPRSGCVILSAATIPIRGSQDAMLVYVFDARRDFLRILAQPGPVPSAETYAINKDGIMLSNSRFPDQLRRVGLLPPDKMVQTPCLLRVCDPGGNLLEGYIPPVPYDQCPLTLMAAQVTAGQSGFDNRGYRDYRGVDVVGIWRWLDGYGFGVAAEMDCPAT